MDADTTPSLSWLNDDMLAIIAGHLVKPKHYWALASVDRHTYDVLVARPDLAPGLYRRMVVMYFRPWSWINRFGSNQWYYFDMAPVRTPELVRLLVRRDPSLVEYLSPLDLTERVLLSALRKIKRWNLARSTLFIALEKAPEHARTKTVCALAIAIAWELYHYVPKALAKDATLRHQAVRINGWALQWMKEGQTPSLVATAVHSNAAAIADVDPCLLTYELCALAVSREPTNLRHLPAPWRHAVSLHRLALLSSGPAPKGLLQVCPDLRHLAIDVHGGAALECMQHTDELCRYALDKDHRALKYVEAQPYSLCEYAVKKNWRALAHSKWMTPELLALRQEGFYKEFPPYQPVPRSEDEEEDALRRSHLPVEISSPLMPDVTLSYEEARYLAYCGPHPDVEPK